MSSSPSSKVAVTACPACDATAAVPDPFYYLWHGNEYVIHRCRACTHQFVHPSISAADQADMYSDHYFSAGGDWVCGMFEGSYSDAEAEIRKEAHEVLAYIPEASGNLLDIGCAGGVFLDEARKKGFIVSGIELNATQAESARTRFSLPVMTGRIEDVPADKWKAEFDVVTLMDCLEHLPRPLDAFRKVAEWTRPGAVVFIRGPLVNDPVGSLKESLRRLVWKRKQLPGYPLDANIFNRRSLAVMLDRAGFDVENWVSSTKTFANVIVRRRRS